MMDAEVVTVAERRQQNFDNMMSRLDMSVPSHQAMAKAMAHIYEHADEKDALLLVENDGGVRPNYHSRAGVELGGYPEVDVLEAVANLEDPFNIFVAMTEAMNGMGVDDVPAKVMATTITRVTGVPTIWGTPGTVYDETKTNPDEANMVPIGDGKYVYNWANESTYKARGSMGRVEVKKTSANGNTIFVDNGEPAIILNETKLDDPALIQTPGHELGHAAEKNEGHKSTEVLPAVYGVRSAMTLAEHDVELAAKAMIHPIELYNWVILGQRHHRKSSSRDV